MSIIYFNDTTTMKRIGLTSFSHLAGLAPYTIIILSALAGMGFYLVLFSAFTDRFIYYAEEQHRAGLVQLVQIARHAIDPIVNQVRTGAISRAEGLRQTRTSVRQMIYNDRYGPNYIFMSSFDGTMLVQPFEPQLEMTRQWDLRDEKGAFIVRELARAAKSGPEGGFVSYHYPPPNASNPQEKLAYALSIPELDCFIGTGMYMQEANKEQRRILTQVRLWSLGIVALLFITSFIAIREMLRRNKALATEIEEHKNSQESLLLFKNLVDNSHDGIYLVDPDSGRFLEANRKAWEMLGYTREELLSLRTGDIELEYRHGLDRQELVRRAIYEGHAILNGTALRKDGETFPTEVSIRHVSMGGRAYLVSVARDVTERRIAEERIKASLHEKETLLREIHHRVKNNFQIITSLLNLQERKIKTEEAAAELAESRDRIRAMALVHEQLYQSDDLSQIDFGQYLRTLAGSLQRTSPARIDMHFQTERIPLAIASAVPCGLIVSELISNAIKHAFPPSFAGERIISLSLKRTFDEYIEIEVRDNGIGLPQDLENRKESSLGLSLAEILVKQIRGSLSVSSREGTTQTLRFSYSGKERTVQDEKAPPSDGASMLPG